LLLWTPAVLCSPLSSARAQTSSPAASAPATSPAPVYTYRADHDPNGIGKFYMGREIAHVMGHEGADWLERPEREEEEAPALLIRSLGLKPGQIVCDLGAGSGYLTVRLARAVAPGGRVKAVDIQQEMLDLLGERLKREGLENVDLVLGDEQDPRLPPASVDLVLMVDVYHEFAWPYEMMQNIVRALRPGGRVVLVEYRKEDPNVPIKLVHKMTARQAILEMRAAGLAHHKNIEVLPRQHILIFTRPRTTTQTAPASAGS
jgi:ubiquinone/menaquinone biosynthesis C-methylase UbiE